MFVFNLMNDIYVISLMMYCDDVMIIYIHNIVNIVRIINEILEFIALYLHSDCFELSAVITQ